MCREGCCNQPDGRGGRFVKFKIKKRYQKVELNYIKLKIYSIKKLLLVKYVVCLFKEEISADALGTFTGTEGRLNCSYELCPCPAPA